MSRKYKPKIKLTVEICSSEKQRWDMDYEMQKTKLEKVMPELQNP